MNRLDRIAVWSIIVSLAIGFYLYPSMPDLMVSHWSASGDPNAYVSKFWGLFLIPLLTTFFYAVFIYFPHMGPDPRKEPAFRAYYESFVYILILFFFYVYVMTVIWNAGFRFMIGQILAPAIAVLYYVIGDTLPHARRNYFFGIRTPWTLANDTVWEKTHKRGANLFRWAGFLALCGAFTSNPFLFIVIPPVVISIYLMWYSWKMAGNREPTR